MVHIETTENVSTTHITQPLWCACYSAHCHQHDSRPLNGSETEQNMSGHTLNSNPLFWINLYSTQVMTAKKVRFIGLLVGLINV